jgi:hypothetical protein
MAVKRVPRDNYSLDRALQWESVGRAFVDAAKRCREALGEYVTRRMGEESTRAARAWAAREWQAVTRDPYRVFASAAPYVAATVAGVLVASLIIFVGRWT